VTKPESAHFRIHDLADGVWAAIATDGGAAICNCGIVDLGGQTVVYDTTLTPHAGQDLRAAAETLTGRRVDWAINSHCHNDHTWGNIAWEETPILASARTRQLMAVEGPEEYRWSLAHAAGKLAAAQQEYEAASAEKRAELLLWLGEYQGIVDALPGLTLRLPDLTFDQRATLHGDRRCAELITFAGGHTGSDTVLFLPQDGVVFASDLLFVGFHPYLGDGEPERLVDALGQMGAWAASTFVPGHGPVGGREDVEQLAAYVERLLDLGATLVAERGTGYADGLESVPVPESFQSWRLGRFFRANLRHVCERLTRGL